MGAGLFEHPTLSSAEEYNLSLFPTQEEALSPGP